MNLGSLRSLGLTTFLLTIPIGLTATLLATRNPFASTEIFTEWIGIGVLSQLAMGAVMFITYRICQGMKASQQRIAVIISVLLAGAVRGATIGILAEQAGLIGTANITMRTLSSAGIFALWLLAIGSTLHANDTYRTQLRDLLNELIATEVVTTSRASVQSKAQSADLEAQITSHVQAIRQALDDTDALGNPAASARLLRAGIEERIRPLSHDLWRESRSESSPPRSGGHFTNRAIRTSPPLRWVIPTLGIAFVVNSLVWNEPLYGLIVGVTFSATFIAILLIAYRHRINITPRRTLMTLVALLVIPPVSVWIVAVIVDFMSPDVSIIIMSVSGVVALALAITGRTVLADRASVLSSLRADIDAIALASEVNAAQQRELKGRTATHLHNTVQSRLTAAVIQLEHAATIDDPALAHSTLNQARSVLANVQLPGESDRHPIERLDEVVTAWSGIASITVHTPEQLTDLIRWHLAVDAIEEAVANAVRHGGAKNLVVSINSIDDELRVSIQDDGQPQQLLAPSGLGSEWITAVTKGRWRRAYTQTGASLTLHLPKNDS